MIIPINPDGKSHLETRRVIRKIRDEIYVVIEEAFPLSPKSIPLEEFLKKRSDELKRKVERLWFDDDGLTPSILVEWR